MEPSPEDVILEEEIDPNYVPSEEELVEYANWLGMDLTNHKNLLWIAKEALVAPLPKEWKPCLTEEDEIYYYNFTTGRSIWDHPCDEYYRQLYKDEVEKLNQHIQQGNKAMPEPNSSSKDQQCVPMGSESNVSPSRLNSAAKSKSSVDSLERVSARDITKDSKNFTLSSCQASSSSISKSDHLTQSLPSPYIAGQPALLNLKGRSFDSMVRSYAAGLAQSGGAIPFLDFLRMQDATNDLQLRSANYRPGRPHNQVLMQSDERRALEKKISQVKERIEKKLVDEERVVLQQERVEMLERVCKQVQQEESHILGSLRREIMERMERNIREETQALLSKRRKEIVEEVEREMRAEKLALQVSQRSEEREHVDADVGASVASEATKLNKTDASLAVFEKTDANTHGQVQLQSDGKERLQSIQPPTEKREGVHDSGAQSQDPSRIALSSHNEKDRSMKDSPSQTSVQAEKCIEKSFHVQDLWTNNVMLKLEVILKIGASSDC